MTRQPELPDLRAYGVFGPLIIDMNMRPAQIAKAEIVREVGEKLARAGAVIVVDYRGLTVAQISDLRRKLAEVGGEMVVVKNTLLARSFPEEVTKGMGHVLQGPSALVLSGDEVSGAKVLAAFAKAAGMPAVKSGLMGDRVLTAEEVAALAAIPGREVLHGQLVGVLAAQPTKLVWALNWNVLKLVSLLADVAKKKAD